MEDHAVRILIVEDERRLAATLCDLLSGAGYETDAADNGEDGLLMMRSGIYDAAILDVMLPKLNGFEVIRRLRKEQCALPVLMLTARAEITDKVTGLDSGADYYLTKPFDNEELLACLRSILRRPGETMSEGLRFADLTLRLSGAELCCGDRTVPLSATEYKLAECLMRNHGQYLSKESLLLKVWGYDAEVGENSVEAYISFLRKKLQLLGSVVSITSARNIGYRMEERK